MAKSFSFIRRFGHVSLGSVCESGDLGLYSGLYRSLFSVSVVAMVMHVKGAYLTV